MWALMPVFSATSANREGLLLPKPAGAETRTSRASGALSSRATSLARATFLLPRPCGPILEVSRPLDSGIAVADSRYSYLAVVTEGFRLQSRTAVRLAFGQILACSLAPRPTAAEAQWARFTRARHARLGSAEAEALAS